MAEIENTPQSSSSSSSASSAHNSNHPEKPESPELKRDSEQAKLVAQAKKDLLAKNRSVSSSSLVRQSGGLAVTSATGLIKSSAPQSTAVRMIVPASFFHFFFKGL